MIARGLAAAFCAAAFVAASLTRATVVAAINEEIVEKFPDGTLKKVYHVDDAGLKQGTYVEWAPNGKIIVRARYYDDALDEEYQSFHDDGTNFVTTRYRRGKLHGDYVERSADGVQLVNAHYAEGQLDGPRTIKRGGKFVSKQLWKSGLLATLDGWAAFPLALDAIRDGLAKINAPPATLPEDPLDRQRVAALTRLKCYRFLAGLAYEDLEIDPRLNFYCMAGARLLTQIGHLDHTPANPGWPEADYKNGYTGTSNSNLFQGRGCDLVTSIEGYMDDSDPSNIGRVGHRRHCLNPALKRTGFGLDGEFSAMWSLDRSRAKPPEPALIAYPSAGFMPVEYYKIGRAWSVTLHLENHALPPLRALEFHVFALDELYVRTAPTLECDFAAVSDDTLIFRPKLPDDLVGQRLNVEIVNATGKGDHVNYLVEFASLAQ